MEKITYSQSFIDFMKKSDCRIAKILYRLNGKPYTPVMVTTEQVNYLTFRGDGAISFLPAGKPHVINENTGEWKREGRQNGKPAKVIRKLFSERVQKYFKDADFECFVNQYKAEFNEGGYCFTLLKNTDIPAVYDMERKSGDGSLNNSCMNGDTNYLDIYKYCPHLQILILKNTEGQLCGRALIWKISADITLMDRVYVTDDFMFDKFLSYCNSQKWWRKKDYKSYDNKEMFIDAAGNEVDKRFTIQTDTEHSEYPYIDTFQYGDDGSLNNYGSGDYTYNNTDGTRGGDEDNHDGESYDEINERYICENDAIYIEHGEGRYRDRTCHVDNCVEVDGNWYYEDDCNIVEVSGKYYETDSSEICIVNGDYELVDDCTYCERDNCYYLSDDCVYCEEDEEDVLESEAVEVDGKYYHTDSDKITQIEDEYYLIESDEIELKDGKYCLIEIEETN